jgi:hypothetical protein
VHVMQCWQGCKAYHAAVSFLMFIRVVSAKRGLVDLAAAGQGTVAKHIVPPLRVRLNISHTCSSVYWSHESCVLVEFTQFIVAETFRVLIEGRVTTMRIRGL